MINWIKNVFAKNNIRQEYYRFFILMNYQYLLAFIGHFSYIFLFIFLKIDIIGYYGIISCIVFIIAFLFNRKGYHSTAFILASIEITIFTSLCVIYTGWNTGFYYFFLAFIALTFFNPIRNFYFKTGCVVVFTCIYVGLNIYSTYFPEISIINPKMFNLIHFSNMIFTSIVLTVSGYYYSKAARDAESELSKTLVKVETVNKQIMDSIQYAELIQSSILPKKDELKSIFPESFVLWKPRDIIGGDIYQIYQRKNGTLIAVLDCTGHGVPGAFMTMLAYSTLNNIVIDEKCYEPEKILKLLNIKIQNSFNTEKENIYTDNGLDASIALIENDTLFYSGAKLPLLYFENNIPTFIEGDKQSLGYRNSDIDYNFNLHKIELKKAMTFYLFTDGFIDQIGGIKGIPFGKTKFINLISENQNSSFENQKKTIIKGYEEYKKNNDPMDDITIIGFSIN